jgi:polar amino acid transport system substrate-binding protein
MSARPGLVARVTLALVAVIAAAISAGCAAAGGSHPPPTATARVAAVRAAVRPAARVAAAATCDPAAARLAPLGAPKVTSGSFMAKIRASGHLIAGVDQSTYHFGYLNPLDGQIEGFDIDMINAVAQAIFGSPGHVEYKAISDAQRIPDILNVDFSSVYFEAHQRVLVLKNSKIDGLSDLGGQKVCATAGSDSASLISSFHATSPVAGTPVLVAVPYWTDCLVLLQQYQVAAISTDDSILDGLAAQDPFTKVVGPELTSEPYGLAISKQHQDFVRFVNAVLAKERADGAWAASYARWVGTPVPAPPTVGYAS